jgi:hypothetical protein
VGAERGQRACVPLCGEIVDEALDGGGARIAEHGAGGRSKARPHLGLNRKSVV